MNYKVHDIEWTDEKVKRFWDFYNNYPAFENLWFSKAVGRGIIRFVNRYRRIRGSVLDYGIGKGHFSSYLLANEQIKVAACDFSEETVANINRQFKGKSNFLGCSLVSGFPSSYEAGTFDFVFLLEAIEHLTDDYLHRTMIEAHRILKPGGIFVITTPNDENLSLQHVICPDCGCVFHRVQHVRSFNSAQLKRLCREFEFEEIFCGATDFHEYNPNGWPYQIKNRVKSWMDKSFSRPHLIYIGEKKMPG